MGKIISLKSDFMFKEIMYNKKILKEFLGDVLGIPAEEICDIRYRNPVLRRRRRLEKEGILDLLVEFGIQSEDTNSGRNRKVDIELQIRRQEYWDKRNIFYLAKMYTGDLYVGEKYSTLKKSICISILDFDYTEREDYHSVYRLRDEKGHEFSDQFELHVIELGKCLNGDAVDDWICLFNAETEEELDMIATSSISAGMQMAIEEIKRLSLTKRMRAIYEAKQKAFRDRQAEDDWIRKEAREEGEIAGEIKGEIKGAISTYQEMNQSRSWIVSKIVERFGLSEEEAGRKVEEYWKE